MFKQYRAIERGELLVIGADTSYGANDYCVAQFYSPRRFDVPIVYRKKVIASEMTSDLVWVLEALADRTGYIPVVAYERQNGGVFEAERLAAMNRLGKYEVFQMPVYGVDNPHESKRLGWDTNSATRPEMLSALKDAIDSRAIRIYDKDTINELFSFIVTQTSSATKAQAERNAHDDCVMSLAIAVKVSQLVDKSKLVYSPHLITEQPEVVPMLNFRRR